MRPLLCFSLSELLIAGLNGQWSHVLSARWHQAQCWYQKPNNMQMKNTLSCSRSEMVAPVCCRKMPWHHRPLKMPASIILQAFFSCCVSTHNARPLKRKSSWCFYFERKQRHCLDSHGEVCSAWHPAEYREPNFFRMFEYYALESDIVITAHM